MPKLETREVLAGAYMGTNPGRVMHTHTVELDDHDQEVRVLCDRVKLESLADPGSLSETMRHAVPSCPTCRRRRQKWCADQTQAILARAAQSADARARQRVLDELYAAACAVMGDLEHYAWKVRASDGEASMQQPWARRERLRAALDAFTALGRP